jgi:hypothetical protein
MTLTSTGEADVLDAKRRAAVANEVKDHILFV